MTSLWVKWESGDVTYQAYTFLHGIDEILQYCNDLTTRGHQWQLLLPDGTIKTSDGKNIARPVRMI